MNDQKPAYHVASFSGGKDSTAMVLHMIERGDHLDEVICCDTTMEFPAMNRHIEKVRKVIEAAGIKFTMLKAEHDFNYWMFDHVPKRRSDKLKNKKGFSWPGPRQRWCTEQLKSAVIRRYLRTLRDQYNVIQYIGLAADEGYRLARKSNQTEDKIYPLVIWGWTEDDAMRYCRDSGYDWEGLYDIFDRVSCWCCPLQGIGSLRLLYHYSSELWQELKRMDDRTWRSFLKDYSVDDLTLRFELEDALISIGESITDRAFHADRKRVLARECTINDIVNERRAKKGVAS